MLLMARDVLWNVIATCVDMIQVVIIVILMVQDKDNVLFIPKLLLRVLG